MKVKVLKDLGLLVIESDLTVEQIKKLEKHQPEALVLRDENNSIMFRVGLDKNAALGDFGILFNKETTQGYAALAIEEKGSKIDIAEKYSVVLDNLLAVEQIAKVEYTNLEARLIQISEQITEEPEGSEE